MKHETVHSPPMSTKVQNAWSFPPFNYIPLWYGGLPFTIPYKTIQSMLLHQNNISYKGETTIKFIITFGKKRPNK
jgi:hypothetical protein